MIASTVPAAAAPIRLLIFGDSLSAGYGLAASDAFQARLAAALKAQGRDVTVIDGAVSGDTTAGGRARLDWAMGADFGRGHGGDAAIVELGGNDGLRGSPPAEMEANLTAILNTLRDRHVPVLFTGMFPPPNMGADYTLAFRAVFDRLGKRPGLIYDPFFLEGVAGDPALNQADRIHPNPAGVTKIVTRLLPLVDQLLKTAAPQ